MAAVLAADPRLSALRGRLCLDPPAFIPDLMTCALRAVCSQQLAGAAASALCRRALTAAGSVSGSALARRLLELGPDRLVSCGLSRAKSRAALGLADSCLADGGWRSLRREDDAAVIARLTAIAGVGPWTAQMILLFGLARPDVFCPGDLGIRRAGAALYGSLEACRAASEGWRPWRSAGTFLLWRLPSSLIKSHPPSALDER